MQLKGKVLSLYISDSQTSQVLQQESLYADKKGVIKDKHYDHNIERSILITSVESYTLLQTYGISVPFGTLGENLLIDYNPYHLSAGSLLKIGKVILEITQHCTLCKHLAVHDKRIPQLLKDDRGIFAKTVQPGSIQKGDLIYLY